MTTQIDIEYTPGRTYHFSLTQFAGSDTEGLQIFGSGNPPQMTRRLVLRRANLKTRSGLYCSLQESRVRYFLEHSSCRELTQAEGSDPGSCTLVLEHCDPHRAGAVA